MKKVYLILAIFGFIVPNIFVYLVSIETGNILLWLNPVATIAGMFTNKISAAFVVDLLIVVLIFIIWSETEAKRYGIKNVWIIWILTFIFGLAGSFPLFLYLVEIRRHKKVKKEMNSSRRHRV
jgi:hypothetical protein